MKKTRKRNQDRKVGQSLVMALDSRGLRNAVIAQQKPRVIGTIHSHIVQSQVALKTKPSQMILTMNNGSCHIAILAHQ
ncbi:hypothetical protein HID58_064059 [Brassica napus]|uniref:Uncharacterized protein n=1 Tax=Brassica napus TaxID=3708 RepID=A0ABQ7Z8X4_BRANA|nr:hypothetical protein HID58_064059 [Brassica napus]